VPRLVLSRQGSSPTSCQHSQPKLPPIDTAQLRPARMPRCGRSRHRLGQTGGPGHQPCRPRLRSRQNWNSFSPRIRCHGAETPRRCRLANHENRSMDGTNIFDLHSFTDRCTQHRTGATHDHSHPLRQRCWITPCPSQPFDGRFHSFLPLRRLKSHSCVNSGFPS
jgi:hypothetical protein